MNITDKEKMTMTVLVAYASKHGSTREIAQRIAARFREHGKEAVSRSVENAGQPGDYETFVIGSAVYYGSWMKEATEWVHSNLAVLTRRPVWLFSSGPLGTEVKDTEQQPKEMAEFQEIIHPRDHRVFFGAIDHHNLGFAERMVFKAVRSPEGDFRDWAAIDAWADGIARELKG